MTNAERWDLVLSVRGLCRSLGNRYGRAFGPDVAQGAAEAAELAAFRSAGNYDPAGGVKFSAFAYVSIHGAAWHYVTRERKRLDHLEPVVAVEYDPEPDPAAAAEAAEDVGRVMRAVESLPPRARQALSYRFGLDGLPACRWSKVAERMGTTEGAANALFFRAVVKIRRQLGVPA